ncbi:MAG: hypothetical protein AAGG44_11555 [Planctomycetota bacterium]
MSTLRLFLVLAMCCVATAGKLPALLHIASEASMASSESAAACHTCSCGHHHHHANTDDQESEESSEHDHRNCRVCQSLLMVFTVVGFHLELTSAPIFNQYVTPQTQCVACSDDILVPDSRGSPLLRQA